MTNLVKELRKTIKEARISPERASHFIGCSAKSVFRWLHSEHNPRPGYQRMIRIGIKKIKEAYPEIKETKDLMQKIKGLWPKIKYEIIPEEKDELLDIQNSQPLEIYIEKLEQLIKKYGK